MFHLKHDKYDKWFMGKAKYTNKEIEAFRYNQAGIDCIKKILMSSRKYIQYNI